MKLNHEWTLMNTHKASFQPVEFAFMSVYSWFDNLQA